MLSTSSARQCPAPNEEEDPMPDLHLPDVRLSELRLPEMTREEIISALRATPGRFDLARFDPRTSDSDSAAPQRIRFPEVDWSRIDVPAAIAGLSQASAMVRSTRRLPIPRLPLVIGGVVVVGLVGFALLRSPRFRPRVEAAGRGLRGALDARRGSSDAETIGDSPVAELTGSAVSGSSVAIPIEPDAFMEDADAAVATITESAEGAPAATVAT